MEKFFKTHKKKLFVKKLVVIFLSIFFIFLNIKDINKYQQDDITLVTALFKIKSKFPFYKYFTWIQNLFNKNTSIVCFIDKNIYKIIKDLRPKIYNNKTVWIQTDIQSFYSYKHFLQDFTNTHEINPEKKTHTINLYLIWAEKCYFVKRAIYHNYFKSKCFYWIDSGFFRKSERNNSLKSWPSANKCNKDPRVIINSMRLLSNNEIQGLINLDINFYNQFIKKINVGGGLFGGQPKYLIKFIKLYYKTIKLFIKNKFYIGNDQNIFTFIAYFHKDIVQLVHSGKWFYFGEYLSN